ncbi:MAG: AAA family ATPase [Nitrospirae bacterium]|nr:AAA family ATPase [Nitrospirota bacterium]
MNDKFKLPVTMLAPQMDPDQLGFDDTSTLTPIDETIGQERAVEALEFGLRMPSTGFNIYASGPVGTGKSTLVRDMVTKLARGGPTPPDWCYVNNFQDQSRPRCLSFPPGQGRAFQRAMAALIQSLRRDIPTHFETAKYLEAKAKIAGETEGKKKALFKELAELAQERGFGFEEAPSGFTLVPLRKGRPMTEEEVDGLPADERKQLGETQKTLESEIREFYVRLHALDHETERRIHTLDRQVVQNVLDAHIETLRRTYDNLPDVLDHLERVREDILTTYKDFLSRELPHLPFAIFDGGGHRPDFTRYQANLIVEHAPDAGAPVVEESHPTYANLIGKIERKTHLGVTFTDFTEIKAGAVLQAGGGYLILNALDLLRQPFAWDALKRVIKTREVKVEDVGEFFGLLTTGLKPQPVPVDVKVILLGPPILYHLLQAYEEDFQKIFKVKADFDVDVPWDDRQAQLYARFVARLCRTEHLPHFEAGAVAELLRHGMRLAERHDRLSLRLSLLSDLVREAGFWAKQQKRALVTRADVTTAITKKRHRADLPEQWIQNEITEGTLMVDTAGDVVGQVNGLSVHLLGDYAFGRPFRITARTFVGTEGVIDIQREAELSGHIHSKGVMTIAGYLAGKFAGSHPFSLSATLTFEQTYSEVEGDSASVAELAAILSSLAETPVHQGLAVTGSVNQLGEIQPIGGVNEKIEGFFESCRKRGLTGTQGVIIPARNTKHLALRHDVVEAVEAGTFSIYGVNRIEDTLELLTELPAGERDAEGRYPDNSLYGRVSTRLAEMAQIVASWTEHGQAKNGK